MGVVPTTFELYCILQYNLPVAFIMRSKPTSPRLLPHMPVSFRSKSLGITYKACSKPLRQRRHWPFSDAGIGSYFGPGIGSDNISIAGSGIVASVGFLLVGGGTGS